MIVTIPITDMPTLAGLIFRSIRGEEDADALRAIHLGRQSRDQVDPLSTLESIPGLEQMQAALSIAVTQHRQDQWLVAQVGEQVVGYNRIISWREADGMWVYLTLGWVLPEWRGNGIGTTLLREAEARIRRLAVAQHPNEPAEFAGNASATETEATTLLLNEGYYVAYTALEMGLDASIALPEPTLPIGIEPRPVLPAHYPLIAESIQEAYHNEFDAGRYAEDFDPVAYATELQSARYDPRLYHVAWDGQQIVGQVLTAIDKERAEIFEVSVRPAWRRRGIARALLLCALHDLRARGIEVVRLHTNANFRTRAKDLYQSVGFRVLKEFPRYRKPFESKRNNP